MLVIAKILLITLIITVTLALLILIFLAKPIRELLSRAETDLAHFRDSMFINPKANLLVLLMPFLSTISIKLLDYFFINKTKSLWMKSFNFLIIIFRAAEAFFAAFSKYTQVKKSFKR